MKTRTALLSAAVMATGLMAGAANVRAADLDPATIAAAKTPAQHEAIAKAFEDEAAKLEREADKHKDVSQTYAQPGGKPWMKGQVKHCDAVVKDLKAAASEDRALAAEHHKMAKQAQ